MPMTLSPAQAQGKPKLRVVCANNPSAMTHTGTISYLLGTEEVVLIDPGPDLPAHAEAILAALAPGERITAILATHAHADHVAGMARLQALTGAPSFAFGAGGSGRSPEMANLVQQGLPDGGEGFDLAFAPDHRLADGQILSPAGFPVTALHTPGHTGCSMSFAVGDWLFTGDLAMGWASSLISPPDGDMAAYMAALTRLARHPWSQLFPGHGPPVDAASRRLAELVAHRQAREAQVLSALAQGLTDVSAITAAIYQDTPPALLPAAMRNVLAHLIDLTTRGRILANPAPLPWARFTPA